MKIDWSEGFCHIRLLSKVIHGQSGHYYSICSGKSYATYPRGEPNLNSLRLSTVKRVKGQFHVTRFADKMDHFTSKVNKENWQSLALRDSRSFSTRSPHWRRRQNNSSIELERAKEKVAVGIEKPRNVTKSEQCRTGMEITAEAGGKIKVSELFVKHRNVMEALRLLLKASILRNYLTHGINYL